MGKTKEYYKNMAEELRIEKLLADADDLEHEQETFTIVENDDEPDIEVDNAVFDNKSGASLVPSIISIIFIKNFLT